MKRAVDRLSAIEDVEVAAINDLVEIEGYADFSVKLKESCILTHIPTLPVLSQK